MISSTKFNQTFPDTHRLAVLPAMNVDKQLAFHKLGIFSLGDLIRYDPFHYARLILMIAEGALKP